MSTKNNPGAFRCYEAALPDEPIFTILGRDPAGPATLRFWAQERVRIGKTVNPDDCDRIDDAVRDASRMSDWRDDNLDPTGDGPTWKLVRITDDDGGPVRMPPENVKYVAAERDGDEAVRLNVEWLQARVRDLTAGQMTREDFAGLMNLAIQSPQRHELYTGTIESLVSRTHALSPEGRDRMKLVIEELGYQKLVRLIESGDGVVLQKYHERLKDAERLDKGESGNSVVLTRNGTTYEFRDPDDTYIQITAEMSVSLGVLVDSYRRNLEAKLDPPVVEMAYSNVTSREQAERIAERSPDVTEIDTPDMPPHRFAMFDKGEGWAYGRGLEINPSSIPAMLDRMEADGYTLVAALGAQADKVGMIFRREVLQEVKWNLNDFLPVQRVFEPRDGGRASESSDRFLAGEPMDEIAAKREYRKPMLTPISEEDLSSVVRLSMQHPDAFVLQYAYRDADGHPCVTTVHTDDWPDWLDSFKPVDNRGRGIMP